MKPFFISILLFLLLGSCENRVEEKQYFASEEPPATPLPDKAPPIPYVEILKLNYEDYINRYEDKYRPKSEITFIMNDLQMESSASLEWDYTIVSVKKKVKRMTFSSKK